MQNNVYNSIIEDGVLKEYRGLDTDVIVPEGVTAIGENAFKLRTYSINSIVLPSSLKIVGIRAFSGCSKLTSIQLPEGLEEIGERAFSSCSSLTSIQLPEGIKTIGKSAFSSCYNLKSIQLPEGIEEIGNNAFEFCHGLESIGVPASVKRIGAKAFFSCTSLSNIIIPDSVTEISSDSFWGCAKLTSLVVPASVEKVGSGAFHEVSNIYYNGPLNTKDWEALSINGYVEDNFVFNDQSREILISYTGNETDVMIPDGVSVIKGPSFMLCGAFDSSRKTLKSIIFPNSLIDIQARAFEGFHGLTELKLPKGLMTIGARAFKNCSQLKIIELPEGLKEINDGAFQSCVSLKSIKIPTSVTRIGNQAFDSCSNLSTVDIPASVTEIGHDAFSECPNLNSLAVPPSVASVGRDAFYRIPLIIYTGSLDTQDWGALSVGEGYFEKDFIYKDSSCKNLVKYIGKDKEPVLPDSLKIISERAFSKCDSIVSLEIPEGVTEIGADVHGYVDVVTKVFDNCNNLMSLTLPDSIRIFQCGLPYNLKSLHTADIETLALLNDKLVKHDSKIKDITVAGISVKEIKNITVTPRMIKSARKPMFLKQFSNPTVSLSDDCFSSGIKIPLEYIQMVLLSPWQIASLLIHQTGAQILAYVRACITKDNANDVFSECAKIIGSMKKLTEKQSVSVAEAALIYSDYLSKEVMQNLSDALESRNRSNEALKSVISKAAEVKEAKPSGSDDRLDNIVNEYNTGSDEYKKAQKLINKRFHLKDSDAVCPMQIPAIFLAEYIKLWNKESTYVKGEQYKVNVLERVTSDCRSETADIIAEELNREELTEYLKSNVEGKNYRTYILPFSKLASDKDISWFIASIRKAKKGNAQERYRAQNSETAMMLSDTRAAQIYFDNAGLLDRYAKIRGTTADDIRTFSIYSFDLDATGKKSYDLGGNSVVIKLNSDMTFSLYDGSTGKEVRSVPKKGSDPEKYKETKADIEEKKTNVKNVRRIVTNRLFDEFISGKGYSYSLWNSIYLSNPVIKAMAKLIVWEQDGDTFTVTDKGMSDVNGNPYEMKESEIKLAHPMEIGKETTSLWQQYFMSNGLKQPFEQIWEPIIDFDNVRTDRYTGCEIPLYRFKDQEKRGITFNATTWFNYRANKYEYESIEIYIKDCSMDWELPDGNIADATLQSRITVKSFDVRATSRQTNHIVSYLDRCTIYGRILKDDDSLAEGFRDYTAAQISSFLKFALENNSTKSTAFLMEYKNKHFSELNGMDEFTLEI